MYFEFYYNPFYNIVNFKNKKLQIITASRKSYTCAQGYGVLYFNLQKPLLKAKMARLEGTFHKLMNRISKTDFLSGPTAKIRSDRNNCIS